MPSTSTDATARPEGACAGALIRAGTAVMAAQANIAAVSGPSGDRSANQRL